MPKSVRIRVPASTSNLGPGFDTLGVALSIANTVEAEAAGRGVELEVVGDIPARLQKPAAEMAVEAVRKIVGRGRMPGLRIRFENQVPVARGLGSSATLRLGVLAAVNELLGLQRPDAEIVQMAAELEGHPDNVAPSFYGGFTVAGFVDGRVRFRKFTVSPTVKFVTVVPALAMETKRARAILPKMVRLGDAVWNMNRTALIVSAF
ncbi:MAG: homoserine kinase, partial [Planctomycetes bacterium]|nr:homoserine kinase [Planctomycetota bacterium]